jgi:pilus assembly protein CpaF
MQKINFDLLKALPDLSAREEKILAPTVKPKEKLNTSPVLSHILNHVRSEISSQRNEEVEGIISTQELHRILQQVAQRMGFELTNFERDEVLAHIEADQKPFGLLQDLVEDASISDIIITDYSKISIQQGRRNFKTDLRFVDQETYEAFVERILQKAESTYSTKKPIADGMIGNFARVHAVHKCLCETGPYLTIRLNRFSSVTCQDLIKSGMAPKEVFDYLRGLVLGGQTILIAGEVGTGKTTLVRALSATIPSDQSILVIEDTPEIRLEHPEVRYLTTREANTDGAGRIAPGECIRAGMRMAMNRIIFGEMRDAEAAEAFIDVCASGHPGISTIHARSALDSVSRLELFLGRVQKGVDRTVLTEQIVTAVQVIVYVNFCKITGARRIMQVKEIGPVADGTLRQREIFSYTVHNSLPLWKTVNKVSAHKEMLEGLTSPVSLFSFPNQIELSVQNQFRDAGNFGGVN